MNKIKISNSIESINKLISNLEEEQLQINFLTDNEGIEFESDEDFDRYIYLESKIDGLKFLANEFLYNTWFGDENKVIKNDYPKNYDTYMKGFTEALDIFINSFN